MKNLLLSLWFIGPSQAAATTLPAAVGAAQGMATAAVAQLATKTKTLRVDACYVRRDDEQADRLSLPKKLCLETLSIVMPENDQNPLSYEAFLTATGTPAATRMHISGAAREAGGWELVGSWLSLRSALEPVCGRLNSAHASVYVKSTFDGTLSGPVVVRAFLMDGGSLCRTSAATVHFDYTRL